MQIITEGNAPSLLAALRIHYSLRRDLLPEATRPHLDAALGVPSPLAGAKDYAEALYAAREHLADEDRALVGQIAHFLGMQGLYLFDQADGPEGRGGRMFQAMRRDLGETVAQAPEDDPEPRAHMVPPAPEPEEPEA